MHFVPSGRAVELFPGGQDVLEGQTEGSCSHHPGRLSRITPLLTFRLLSSFVWHLCQPWKGTKASKASGDSLQAAAGGGGGRQKLPFGGTVGSRPPAGGPAAVE